MNIYIGGQNFSAYYIVVADFSTISLNIKLVRFENQPLPDLQSRHHLTEYKISPTLTAYIQHGDTLGLELEMLGNLMALTPKGELLLGLSSLEINETDIIVFNSDRPVLSASLPVNDQVLIKCLLFEKKADKIEQDIDGWYWQEWSAFYKLDPTEPSLDNMLDLFFSLWRKVECIMMSKVS